MCFILKFVVYIFIFSFDLSYNLYLLLRCCVFLRFILLYIEYFLVSDQLYFNNL